MALVKSDLEKIKHIHRIVLNFLKEKEPGILLDAPAGKGALANCLSKIGFQVHCCDLYPENFQVPHLTCQRVDLNRKLPYANDYFQYIICLESVQLLENLSHLIREFSRILKKEGMLIIALPNVLNIQSRFRFLIRGDRRFFKPRSQLPATAVEWAKVTINPVSFREVELALKRYKYSITTILSTKIKPKIYLYFPLIWFIRIFTWVDNLFSKDKRKKLFYRTLISREVLLGEKLIIVAQKISETLD